VLVDADEEVQKYWNVACAFAAAAKAINPRLMLTFILRLSMGNMRTKNSICLLYLALKGSCGKTPCYRHS